jgi:NADP-dependent 3-hydroxy acid dehydrogenase YdfG
VGDVAVICETAVSANEWKLRLTVGDTNCVSINITTTASKPKPSHRTEEQHSRLFPLMEARTSQQTVSALLECSHYVGMICPGLYSLFASLNVALTDEASDIHHPDFKSVAFDTEEFDDRFNLYTIAVSGILQGNLRAFRRPEPITAPDMHTVSSRVSPEEFKTLNALVIGGSRGIGACTAKMLACGGAKVLLTYRNSHEQATTIQNEINTHFAGCCKSAPLDITCEQIDTSGFDLQAINAVFYFATPQICKNSDQQAIYRAIYCDGLTKLCNTLEKTASDKIYIFMPSSVFLEKPDKNFASYTDAKIAAEKLADDINQQSSHIHIIKYRLPPMATDQTLAPGAKKLPPVLDSILPFIRQFYQSMALS